MPIIPVILSGGAGSRLWPASREGYPKPFMKLPDGESLLLKSYRRAMAVAGALGGDTLLTVTNRDYYFMSRDVLAEAGIDEAKNRFLLEPFARNTAPAIALAAHQVAEAYGRDALMLVLPADHLIRDQAAFVAAVARAAERAQQQELVAFGITPAHPETGFGYIEAGEPLNGGRKVVRFVEKPSLEKARDYLAKGNFLWNSGMFCFQAGVMLDEITRHAPQVATATQAAWNAMLDKRKAEDVWHEIPAAPFRDAPDISIDYAVMEKSARVSVVAGDFDWSDIGSWNAISELVAADVDNNRSTGEAIFIDSQNTFVQSDNRLVATVGLENLLIIDTPDALLIARADKAQEVKKVVAQLKAQNHETYRLHRTVVRPWGSYTVLEAGNGFKIKRIEVKPGASLSLQMHHHRSEHWIVVSGMAQVTNGEREFFVRANESTYIPAGHTHRLQNPGLLKLVMIEVQSGEYLGEDDIVRLEDVYGRN